MRTNGKAVTAALSGATLDERPAGITAPTRPGRRSSRLIGQVVVDLGFANVNAVETAVAAARAEGKTTGQVLVEAGVLREDELARVLSERFGIDYIDLSVYEADIGAINLIGAEAAKRYQAVPVGFADDGGLLVAMADPTNVLTVDDIAMMTGLKVRPAVASHEDIRMLIGRLNHLSQSVQDIEESEPDPEPSLEEAEGDAPIIRLVHSIIGQGVEQGASDIHCDPENGELHVRFRVDGVLHPAATIPRKATPGVVSRIKIMSNLDIAEKRVSQDGRLAVTIDGRRIDVRVVTLPLVGGEGVIMRILDRGVVVRSLDELGMLEPEKSRFMEAIQRRQGAVLTTGPTASGKSTTLYGALDLLNTVDRSILTIEDPVESPLAGIKQMQVAAKKGVTFATGLRSMLRADPDVIMVGEIRDRETAHTAIQAALTGHLLLSTLHTRDAPGALTRLVDMGIEPFLVASAIDCVVGQRLARTLCTHCKRPSEVSPAVLAEYGLYDATPYEAVGCPRCAWTGYRGRLGIYEVMSVTEELRSLILTRSSVDEMAECAVRQGMRRMRDDGLEKVRLGLTSIVEVSRVIGL
jgi:type IV pilus assembly protein PilB